MIMLAKRTGYSPAEINWMDGVDLVELIEAAKVLEREEQRQARKGANKPGRR